ncbi:hypothetical protein SELMODRAFT_447687 [Selaginella moellendorffii]|uniref:Uncharacterized protein n=1 Tax=Selaginella moellendorffii TaxID=88036 RepID=D8T1J6_SELML|nr:hypothetical protein SELMODRAFT_447687 [Selaginella moellendorffii]
MACFCTGSGRIRYGQPISTTVSVFGGGNQRDQDKNAGVTANVFNESQTHISNVRLKQSWRHQGLSGIGDGDGAGGEPCCYYKSCCCHSHALHGDYNAAFRERSSSYGTGEVIEAEFSPVVEEEAPPPVANPEIPQGDQAQYQMDGGQAQYEMDGGQAQYEMDGGSYDQEYDEQQYYEGYDQSQQYQQYDQSQYDPSQQQQSYDQSPYAAAAVEEKPKEPPPHYDNIGKVMKFIALGRAMQFKLDSQKDFERFLDKCSAYGVMIPEAPSDIKRNLCELDPKETWIVVDSRAVMKFAKKLALEEAERNKDDYPPGFVENMLNRDKYGRYKSDDDY